MYAIAIEGKFLEGVPDLSFELQNSVFSSADTASLPGSFSFPFSLPASRANRVLLGQPSLISNTNNPKTFSNVWAYLYGSPIFFGDLQVRQASDRAIQCNFVSNAFSGFKDIALSNLDLGGEREVPAGALSWATYMLVASQNPEEHDFNFAPVKIVTEEPDDDLWVNKFLNGTFHGYTVDSKCIAPQAKVSYLLQQMFSGGDWKFVNAWQLTTELTRLLVYDHQDVRVAGVQDVDPPVLPTLFNLQNHVPNMKSGDFLKRIAAVFNLGVFTSIWDKTISLRPLVQILGKPPLRDWTRFMVKDSIAIEKETTAPGKYGWKNQPEELYKGTPPLSEMTQFRTETDLDAALSANPTLTAWAHVESNNIVVRYEDGVILFWKTAYQHQSVETGDGDEMLLDFEQFGAVRGADGNYREYLRTDILPAFWSQSEPGQPYEKSESESPFGLIMFRGWGLQGSTGNQFNFPKCGHHVWNPYASDGSRSTISGAGSPAPSSEVSLNWHGEYGLFEKWHRAWHDALRYGKDVSATFVLPVSQLIPFQFDEKIRVASMDYFVKKLRVGKPLGKGLVLVEASLISVI